MKVVGKCVYYGIRENHVGDKTYYNVDVNDGRSIQSYGCKCPEKLSGLAPGTAVKLIMDLFVYRGRLIASISDAMEDRG